MSDWSSDVCSSDLGDCHAVKDLSFHVEHGELYALLGTNGAGKTSALEVIEGHRRASSGTVSVFGASPTDRAAVRPRMGMMLQESGFSPDLSVSESIALIGQLSGRSDVVDRVLETVDLRGKAHTRVSRSEEHTSELQSLMRISYAVFCLKKKKKTTI